VPPLSASPVPPESSQELLAQRDRELHDEQERLRLDAEAEVFAEKAERELRARPGGEIPPNAVRLNLPANSNPLGPQDPCRRASFREHLSSMVEGAVLDRERIATEPPEAGTPASGRETLSAGACTACRGGCCRAGGDQAYLTEETIARSLEAHPTWTLAQILDSYLEHLPAESYLNSCIYHAATGCGLPRALRSSTCNRYQCLKLTTLRGSLPENNPPPVLALMFDRGQWIRTALLDETGVRTLAE
jgi:hypothetical protein